MLEIGDSVYFTTHYQRLLYSKGYKAALSPWRIVDRVSDTQVRVAVDTLKRTPHTSNHLVVHNTCVVKPS